MVSYQSGLLSACFIRWSFSSRVSSGWSLARVVSSDGLSSAWSLIRVVTCEYGLSLGWSRYIAVIRVVSSQVGGFSNGVFHHCGLLLKKFFYQRGLP